MSVGFYVYRWRKNECSCGETYAALVRFWIWNTDDEEIGGEDYLVNETCPHCEAWTSGLSHWWLTDWQPTGSVFIWDEQIAA